MSLPTPSIAWDYRRGKLKTETPGLITLPSFSRDITTIWNYQFQMCCRCGVVKLDIEIWIQTLFCASGVNTPAIGFVGIFRVNISFQVPSMYGRCLVQSNNQ